MNRDAAGLTREYPNRGSILKWGKFFGRHWKRSIKSGGTPLQSHSSLHAASARSEEARILSKWHLRWWTSEGARFLRSPTGRRSCNIAIMPAGTSFNIYNIFSSPSDSLSATPLNIAAAAARWASLNRKVGPRDRRGSYFIFVHEASRIESTRYLLALFIMLLSVASAPLGSAVSGGTAKRDCRQHQPAICGSPGRRRRSCL